MALQSAISSRSLFFGDLVSVPRPQHGHVYSSRTGDGCDLHVQITRSILQSDSMTSRGAKDILQQAAENLVGERNAPLEKAKKTFPATSQVPLEELIATLDEAESTTMKTLLLRSDVQAPHKRHFITQRRKRERKITLKDISSIGTSRPTRFPERRSGMKLVMSAVCNLAESFITRMEPQELPQRSDPRIQMEGNWAPVVECPPQQVLEVTGTIPTCLNGAYIRNGSNPKFMPTAGYHYFDGDGMLHVVRIKDGLATYCCRFTKTNRLLQEEKAGKPLFPKVLGELHGLGGMARLALFNLRGMSGLVDSSKGMGAANAGLEFFNGTLFAMSEDDMPYAVRVTEEGDVETLGRCNFGEALETSMTAHPKIDPKTGEMFSFSYDVQKAPYLTYFRVAPNGVKGVEVPITISEPNVVHDFAVTEKYVIFPEGQVVFRLRELFSGKFPIVVDEKKVSRFGVLPKNAKSEATIQWFDLPDSTCFHYVNAWEEGDEVVVLGCNNLYIGRRTRYIYMSLPGPWPKISGVAKVDLEALDESSENGVPAVEKGIAGWRQFAPGCFGGEPYFVPRSTDTDIAEDDGYVVTHYHNEITGVSELLILDAQSPNLEIVASLKMPTRVPYGFHGAFVTEEQLKLQRSALS